MYDFYIQKGVIVKSDMTYINIASNIGLDEKSFSLAKGFQFSCLLSCALLQSLLIERVSTHLWVLCHLLEINSFITTHVSGGKPREMLNGYIIRKRCHFELFGLKDFFVLFATALETALKRSEFFFFLSVLLKAKTLGLKSKRLAL